VVIGTRQELLGRGVRALEMNWLADAPSVGDAVQVQVRHRAPAAAAEVVRISDGEVELALNEPVSAIAPGQSLVLYRNEQLLGGGFIESSVAASRPSLPLAFA
jgi:tRNA-specific 2-thiouridylase